MDATEREQNLKRLYEPIQVQALNLFVHSLAPHKHLLPVVKAQGLELPSDVRGTNLFDTRHSVGDPHGGVTFYAHQARHHQLKGWSLSPDQVRLVSNCNKHHSSQNVHGGTTIYYTKAENR